MICELLKDGFVDAALPVTLFNVDEEYCEGTALHWACRNGYFDLVLLLLTYFNVDVCSEDTFGNEPIHDAAQNGHTESYSF
jgi:ankyrin repeat protein